VNASKEIVLRINPEELYIKVENVNNGVTSYKEITGETFYQCIKGSIRREAVDSDFLPPNCFHVRISTDGERDYCLWYPELYADISYFGTEYRHFPIPRLVFGFRVGKDGKVFGCRLGVVEDTAPNERTPMFTYPFSNVGGFNLCVGNNALPVYKRPVTLGTLPGYLLRLPNNNDRFNAKDNKLHMQYRELLNHLKDKDPAYYYTDVLIPNGKTLKDFIG